MHPLIQQLVSSGPVLTDGAWGTQLQARGLGVGECPDGWNLSHPEQVAQVARAYVEAGSQIILTNTFGANRFRLRECGWESKVDEINRAGVAISRQAAWRRAFVFASMGPSGKLLANGDITSSELRIGFAEQARSLAAACADALVIETVGDLEEARIAVAAARDTGLPVVACMVFDSGKNNDRTMMGTTPEEAAAVLTSAGAEVIGANCGKGVAGFASLCRRLRAATQLPIWVKPNAGLPYVVNGKPVYSISSEEFAELIATLIDGGASFVGGCCGTNPDFIRAIHRRIHTELPRGTTAQLQS
jgi:methionine synthase I (cobalamin-dependent)